MQHLTTSRAEDVPTEDWPDEHAPLLADGYGPLAAFDQPPLPRANRVPRVAPQRPGLFRRLHTGAKRLYLEWLLYSLGKQVDQVEAELVATAVTAHQAAGRHRISPKLNTRRKALRQQYATLASRMLIVRRDLDNLQVSA